MSGSSKVNIYPVSEQSKDLYPKNAINKNGPDDIALERWKIREICEGWGMYRDAAEWENYRTMFHPEAYIATSWHQGPLEDFIKASIEAFNIPGFYIVHRLIGSTVDLSTSHPTRAVCKIKVCITTRFTFDDIESDVENDCRFFFLLEKRDGNWGVSYYTLLFDKDKVVPVNPNRIIPIDEEEVKKFPSGYRYLAYFETKSGRPPLMSLDVHGPGKAILQKKCVDWLDGKSISVPLTEQS